MTEQSRELLEFLYRSPIALVTSRCDGTIQTITPMACQWLMPLSDSGQLDNLFVLLEGVVPDLRELAANRSSDVICENRVVHVPQPNTSGRYLSVTINHFTDGYIAAMFSDVTSERLMRQEAESAAQFKASFLANMSHEIRTPLNAIANMAYLLRRDGISPSQASKLDKLDNASQHLLSIISDILDLTKIDSGKLELEVAPLRGFDIVESVVSMMSERAQLKGVELRVEDVSLPANLLGDFTRLQQALANYVSNAIKFTASGHITIRARTCEDTGDSALLRFEVSDTGIGIEPLALKRLFLAFEQADNSTTRKYGGSGLGLSITKQLARLMGGDADASSEVGVGSTFWFTARLLKSAGPVVHSDMERLDAENVTHLLRDKYAGIRVLVAEDDPINAEIACTLLDDVGFAVDLVEDGQDALDLAAGNHYELMLMDMQMPRMDGLEAAQAVRQLANHLHTPIIAISANAFVEDRARCLNAGMGWFVTKPVFPDKLYAVIYDALESSNRNPS